MRGGGRGSPNGMDGVLNGLNEAQKIAVTNPANVLQVLAPPGSGKTKTLTSRVGYLIAHHGIPPQNILVSTFTVKAANEMQSRIAGFFGQDVARRLILGTFHSIARRFLAKHGAKIGLPNRFSIADTSDTTAIITRIIKRCELTITPATARARISTLKSKSQSVDQFSRSAKTADQQEISIVFSEYEEHLRLSNLLDFDDLLLRCVDLLRSHRSCIDGIDVVLVDEFQDTNKIQYDLMRLFAQRCQNITIVGDPDQSIYGWRNAEIGNLKLMQKQYPDTCVVNLEENYRSSGAILLSAQEIIEQDTSRPAKRLMPTHSIGMQPVLRKFSNAWVEASWILSEIKRTSSISENMLTYSDYAILLRTASISRQIESELGKAGIPYRMVGGFKFFERLEVKLVLDYLRVVSHLDHSDALARILNVPSRKIGDVTARNLLDESDRRKITLWNCILSVARGQISLEKPISHQAQKGIELFTNLMLTLRRKLEDPSNELTLEAFVTHLIKKLELDDYLHDKKSDDCEARLGNVQELVAQAADFAAFLKSQIDQEAANEHSMSEDSSQALPLAEQLSRFLANVSLSAETPKDNDQEKIHQVTISTIHAAKGLEWPIVFIPAAYDGSIPHSRSENHDEERRLLYVAMTRAQVLLYLSFPEKSSQESSTTLSPFLAHRHMESFFDTRGPNLNFSVASEIANTLRRQPPEKVEIERILCIKPELKDDVFALEDKSKQSESAAPRNYSDRSFNMTKFQSAPMKPFKPPQRVTGVAIQMGASLQTTTSIALKSEYSISSTTLSTGFMTATSFLAVQKDRSTDSKENKPPSAPKIPSVALSTGKKRKAEQVSKDHPNQRNLNNYFVKRLG